MQTGYHIGFSDAQGAVYAILPGDPGRVPAIAAQLENARFLCENREYRTYIGFLDGVAVLVMSTGMGGPSTAIAVEELYTLGVRTFIRVGTCGGMQPQVIGGDVVVASASIRMEGTTREYVPVEFPAVADPTLAVLLHRCAGELGHTAHLGVVQSKDSFYGQHDPTRMPAGEELSSKWRAWIRAGCLASEMESAALFIVSQVLRCRAGAVFSVVWNQERAAMGYADAGVHDTTPAIQTAVAALRALIAADAAASM